MTTYKIAMLGDGGSGKSSILDAKLSKNFQTDKKITIGVDFDFIPFNNDTNEKDDSQFLVYDLGGQKRFQFIHDAYLKGIKGAVVLFDVSRFQTFKNIDKWIQLTLKEGTDIPILIVANKMDLINEAQKAQFDQDLIELVENYKPKCNIYGYIFASAKERINIDEIFSICEEMILWEQKSGKKVSIPAENI